MKELLNAFLGAGGAWLCIASLWLWVGARSYNATGGMLGWMDRWDGYFNYSIWLLCGELALFSLLSGIGWGYVIF